MARPTSFIGPLSFKLIEGAYVSLTYGNTEPDVIKCSKALKDRIRVDLYNDAVESTELLYNGARIVVDDSINNNNTIIVGFNKVPTHFKSLDNVQPFATITIKDS